MKIIKEANFQIIANKKLGGIDPVGQVKKVLDSMDVSYITGKVDSDTIFSCDADEDQLQKLRAMKWKAGIFHD